MESIDQVSINDLSKRDLLLLIKALEFTGENTKLEEFINLKNNIVKKIQVLLWRHLAGGIPPAGV